MERRGEHAGAVLDLGLEHVAVQNAAVDQGSGGLFVVVGSVAADKVPALFWEELVCSWDGVLPVLFAVDFFVDALAVLEPVDWATEEAQADEEIGGHDVQALEIQCWLWLRWMWKCELC